MATTTLTGRIAKVEDELKKIGAPTLEGQSPVMRVGTIADRRVQEDIANPNIDEFGAAIGGPTGKLQLDPGPTEAGAIAAPTVNPATRSNFQTGQGTPDSSSNQVLQAELAKIKAESIASTAASNKEADRLAANTRESFASLQRKLAKDRSLAVRISDGIRAGIAGRSIQQERVSQSIARFNNAKAVEQRFNNKVVVRQRAAENNVFGASRKFSSLTFSKDLDQAMKEANEKLTKQGKPKRDNPTLNQFFRAVEISNQRNFDTPDKLISPTDTDTVLRTTHGSQILLGLGVFSEQTAQAVQQQVAVADAKERADFNRQLQRSIPPSDVPVLMAVLAGDPSGGLVGPISVDRAISPQAKVALDVAQRNQLKTLSESAGVPTISADQANTELSRRGFTGFKPFTGPVSMEDLNATSDELGRNVRNANTVDNSRDNLQKRLDAGKAARTQQIQAAEDLRAAKNFDTVQGRRTAAITKAFFVKQGQDFTLQRDQSRFGQKTVLRQQQITGSLDAQREALQTKAGITFTRDAINNNAKEALAFAIESKKLSGRLIKGTIDDLLETNPGLGASLLDELAKGTLPSDVARQVQDSLADFQRRKAGGNVSAIEAAITDTLGSKSSASVKRSQLRSIQRQFSKGSEEFRLVEDAIIREREGKGNALFEKVGQPLQNRLAAKGLSNNTKPADVATVLQEEADAIIKLGIINVEGRAEQRRFTSAAKLLSTLSLLKALGQGLFKDSIAGRFGSGVSAAVQDRIKTDDNFVVFDNLRTSLKSVFARSVGDESGNLAKDEQTNALRIISDPRFSTFFGIPTSLPDSKAQFEKTINAITGLVKLNFGPENLDELNELEQQFSNLSVQLFPKSTRNSPAIQALIDQAAVETEVE